MPAVFALYTGDFMQGITSGIIRGMGYQNYGTPTCIFGYWVIALPISYILGFYYDLGMLGIWLGMPMGVLVIAIIFLCIIYTTDFDKLSKEVIQRVIKEKEGLNE